MLCDFPLLRSLPEFFFSSLFYKRSFHEYHLVLDLADKYPRESLAEHILDCVAQFLPALLCQATRPGRVRQIISNAKRFQRGDWKYLWDTALRLARRETDNNVEHNHKRTKRDTSSIKARGPLRAAGSPF